MESQLRLEVGGLPARSLTGEPELGEVFTRPWVVELILDLAGYTPDLDLATWLAVEPACGEGAFLGPMIDRLLASAGQREREAADLQDAIRAFDLSPMNVERARKLAASRLVDSGVEMNAAQRIAETWITCDDFLITSSPERPVDMVVGNPPYIRLENVPPERMEAYRRMCPTMRGRSDVYVGFIERGLRILAENGVLGFIVADRWMHNQYGADLRRLIGEEFAVKAVIEMHEVDAFEDEVSAYPAVTIVRRERQRSAVIAQARSGFGPDEAAEFRRWARRRGRSFRRDGVSAARLGTWFPGDELWPAGDPTRLALIADLESRFPPLEDGSTGTRVGIGVASGADGVYLTRNPDLVEGDRLLPLAISGDTTSGHLSWSGTYLVNPWREGRLVSLDEYPRLAAYFDKHALQLRGRHVAKRRPSMWYRTIDRVDPSLQHRPKLVLPDIKAAIHPVLDGGGLYPHHNLYFVVSAGWDLEVLGGILLSEVANLVVGAYCVKMRGGCYRFQAQYLRRIRVPERQSISASDCRELASAFAARDREWATAVAVRLYGIDDLPRLPS